MGRFMHDFKIYTIRGVLASIPLGAVIGVIYLLYVMVDQKVMNILSKWIGFRIPGLGIVILLVFFYLIGYVVSTVIGNRLMDVVENITSRVPLLKTIYTIGKQIAGTFSNQDKQVFKEVVLVKDLRPMALEIGFLVGTLSANEGKDQLLRIYLPTSPNPTSGKIVIIPKEQTVAVNWTVEEAMRLIISGGLIGPETLLQK